ncbi:MAG: tRNA(His) guanylyltransferase Thg1 family protein [Lachnospiraceae bacterium]|nr:tRNA(His) guanylyltransferase Thg1 family protein [Lachnospiraceae bacterium]MCM1230701.1 tRNA(His) guanylyltransferase Thg1 family protein [Ruminococcus flavefaciens]
MKSSISLGERMKAYEGISRNFLMRRTPAIIRVDGKAFHSFTRGFDMFDHIMDETMKFLCENIQGCVMAYKQSDEISLVLTDYATIQTDAWFGYNIQKMSSIAASMATLEFNRKFRELVNAELAELKRTDIGPVIPTPGGLRRAGDGNTKAIERIKKVYASKFNKALFDARVFSLPVEEVCNYMIWRQQDATRNSIEIVGRTMFGHARMKNVTCNQAQDLLFKEKGINWNDYPTVFKRGCCCIKVDTEVPTGEDGKFVVRRKWKIDDEIPIFTKNREYIETLL